MGRDPDAGARLDVAPGTARGLLWRAALLAGHGPDARELADVLLACTRDASTRTCLDAGARLQLTIDAPGAARLDVGLRLGSTPDRGALTAAIGDTATRWLAEQAELARAEGLSTRDGPAWLFCRGDEHELVLPLERGSGAAAIAAARRFANDSTLALREPNAAFARDAQPWAIAFASRGDRASALRLAWLVPRGRAPTDLLDTALAAHWPLARSTCARLLGRDLLGGRWMLLDALDEPGLGIGTTAWSLVPEHDGKHDTLGRTCMELGGQRQWADSLWTLCRATAPPRWRVGRAFELRIDDEGVRVRWFLVPSST